MLTFFVILLGILDLIIGSYLLSHRKNTILGFSANEIPQLVNYGLFYGFLFIIFGLVVIIFTFTNLAIIAIIFTIFSMFATIALTLQFSVFFKHMH